MHTNSASHKLAEFVFGRDIAYNARMDKRLEIFISRALYSRAIIFACTGFILGIALQYIFSFSHIFFALIFATVFFVSSFFTDAEKQSQLFCIGTLFLFCATGTWYGGMRMNTQFANSHIGFYASVQGEKVILEGTVAGEAQETATSTRVTIDTHSVTLPTGRAGKVFHVQGAAQVFFPLHTAIEMGQEVEASGALQTPQNFSGFDYTSYLASQGIEALLMHAKIESVQAVPISLVSSVQEKFEASRLYAKNFIGTFIPGSEEKIIAAMTLGYGNELPQQLSDMLSRAGIRYLMAISGLHIMVIANALIILLLVWGFGRRMALTASFAIIFLFGALIAFPLPALRAILMAGVLYIGQFIGRPLNIFRTLLYAASAMLLVRPLLFADIGFQLSFAGLLGILLLAPFFEETLQNIFLERTAREGSTKREKIYSALKKRNVWALFAMSLAATIFTFPLTLFHFGVVSLWGVVMSIIAIPLLPPLFMLTCMLIVLGTFNAALGTLIAFPLWTGVHIFLTVARFFSSQTIFIFSTDAYNAWVLVGGYSILALAFFVIVHRGYKPLQASIRFFRFEEA